jgi:L-arabinose transport system substrate-binding protein
MIQRRTLALATLAALACSFTAHAAEPVKIGFLVKQAEEPWFQDEWRFAEQAAKEKGFTLVKIGIPNGEKMMAAIDNLAAQKVQGFVICAPDVKLGAAVSRAAKRHKLKVMSVDDQLVDGAGKPIADIPHMGISGYEIGKQVGQGLAEEIKARGWNIAEVGALRIAFDQLPTARERTQGALDALKAQPDEVDQRVNW